MKIEWTSVNEKLPDYDKDVLIWTSSGVSIARLWEVCKCGDIDHFSDGTWCADLDTVTHWQALPKSPAPKEKEIRVTTKKKKPLNRKFNASLKNKNGFNFWG